MAPSLTSYQTVDMIDVSQNMHSPTGSRPAAKDSVVLDANDERVGNSFPYADTHKVTPAIPRQPFESEEDDDDSMYALSPKGKLSHDAAKVSAMELAGQHDTLDEAAANVNLYTPEAQAGKRAEAPRNAIDDMLAKGATARPFPDNQRRAKEMSRNGHAKATQNELQKLSDKPDGPAGAHSDGSSRPISKTQGAQTRQKQAAPSKRPEMSKTARTPAASTATSSLAALRAKREGLAVVRSSKAALTGPAAVVSTKNVRASEGARPPLKEQSKNVQTPARTDSKVHPTKYLPTTGKLVSRRTGMFAQTPTSRLADREQSTRKRKAAERSVNDEGDLDGDDRPAKKANQMDTSAPGTLKRLGKAMKASASTARRPTYDIPESSPKAERLKPAKRSQANVKPTSKKQSAITNKAAQAAKHQPDNYTPNAMPKKRSDGKQKPVEAGGDEAPSGAMQTRKPPSKQTRAPVEDSSQHLLTELDATIVVSTVPAAKPRPTEKRAVGQGSRLAQETIEDFEQAVMHFADDKSTARLTNRVPAGDPVHVKAELAMNGRAQHHTSVETGKAVKKGASQDQAIILSDRPEPSSPAESSPRREASMAPPMVSTTARDRGRSFNAPHTPAVFQSSPPVARQSLGRTHRASLIGADMSRKSTIISFDKSGPRNQGSASAKKSAAGSAWTDRTSLPPKRVLVASEGGGSRAGLDARHRNSPASATTSMKSTRTNRTAPRSNVAESVGDALAGFFKKFKQRVPAPVMAERTLDAGVQKATKTAQRSVDKFHDDAGFMFVDDFEGTTLINDEPAAPPPLIPKPSEASTASQQAMPPPAPKAPRTAKVYVAPTVPSMLSSEDQSALRDSRKVKERLATKRAITTDHDEVPAGKRPRTVDVAPVQLPPPAATTAAILKTDHKVSRAATQPMHDPTKRASRKPSRHTSQGNVDMHGSPIPKGLLVMNNATALEAFSQQAGLSSDQALAETGTATAMQQADQNVFDDAFLPPSHQPEVLSSNAKPRPGSPDEESQAISGIAVRNVNLKQLLIHDVAAPPATDPFTSSQDARKEPSKGSTSSIFAEQLRQRKTHDVDTRRRTTKDDQVNTLLEPHTSTSTVFDGQLQQRTAQNLNEQRQAGSNDPDKTLVEPVPAPKSRSKRLYSLSSDTSSNGFALPDATGATTPETGVWRKTLQPHQLNLFDELVSISHRLVRQLVAQEARMHEVVNDYRRRGLTLIEEMERAQAEGHQNYVQSLKEKKQRLQKGLSKCSEHLKSAVAAVEEGKEKRTKESESREGR